eukprot:4967268-Prymnesium_polylepis.1
MARFLFVALLFACARQRLRSAGAGVLDVDLDHDDALCPRAARRNGGEEEGCEEEGCEEGHCQCRRLRPQEASADPPDCSGR